MAGVSKFRIALVDAINKRLDSSGGRIDAGRVEALADDVEVVINNSTDVLGDVANDLDILRHVPRAITIDDELKAILVQGLRDKGFQVNVAGVQDMATAINSIINREVAKGGLDAHV